MANVNTRGQLNTIYLKALREIGQIVKEIKTPLPDRITKIRKVMDRLNDETWKVALAAEAQMMQADAELTARHEADAKLEAAIREHSERVEELSRKRYEERLFPREEDASPAEATAEEADEIRGIQNAWDEVYRRGGNPL